MREVPRPWAGIALLGTLWAVFAIGAMYGQWPWRPDFWPYFYTGFLLTLVVPLRFLSAYLVALASLVALFGVNCFVVGYKGRDVLLAGFLFAAAILCYAAWRARKVASPKKVRAEEEPPLHLPRNPYAF